MEEAENGQDQDHKEKTAILIFILSLLLQLDSDWRKECLVHLCGFYVGSHYG